MSGRAELEAAIEALAEAEDEARTIAASPSSGAKPRTVSEAVLEALPLCRSALEDWPDDHEPERPDEGDGRVHVVADDEQLARAIAEARPGDTVELRAGTYGTTKLTGKGVEFRAAEPLAAEFAKTVTMAEGTSADGLAFENGLELHGCASGCRIRAESDDVMACLELAGYGACAEWCEVVDFAHRGVLFTGKDTRCSDSYVHGQRPGAASNTDGVAATMFGGWKAHDEQAQEMLGAVLESCLIEDLEWRCAVEGKASGWTVDQCTAIGRDGRDADCYVRHGTDCTFRSTLVEKGGIQLGGDRNRADACEASNEIAFKKGGVTMDEMRKGASGYPYARDCVITDTDSRVVTDWANGSGEDWAHMPEGSKVASVGEVVGKGPYEVDEDELPEPPPPPARRLRPDEVGPGARPVARR